MADTLKQYCNKAMAVTNTAANLFTAGPSGGIVRNIHLCNTTAAAVTVNISIGANGATTYAAATALYTAFSIPANGVHIANVNIFMAANTTLNGYSSGSAGAIVATITGVDL